MDITVYYLELIEKQRTKIYSDLKKNMSLLIDLKTFKTYICGQVYN